MVSYKNINLQLLSLRWYFQRGFQKYLSAIMFSLLSSLQDYKSFIDRDFVVFDVNTGLFRCDCEVGGCVRCREQVRIFSLIYTFSHFWGCRPLV